MLGGDAMGEYSQRVIQQNVMNRIGLSSDNMLVQYVVSLLAITMLGVLTSKMSDWSTAIAKWIRERLSHEEDTPTLKFVITKRKTAGSIQGSTTAVLAWMEQIALSVDKEKDTAAKEMIASHLVKLRGVAITTGYDDWGWDRMKNHWLPDQAQQFCLDTNIFVQFNVNQIQSKDGGDAYSYEEYEISVQTTHALGLAYLLKYHNEVVDKYERKLSSKFESQSHVFKFDSFDKDSKEITWTVTEFSSARKLKHIWFKEKACFVNAYKNFLYHKEDYDERGDPYTFSMLLHGPPGCGKTSLLKSLINYDQTVRKVTSHLFVVPFAKVTSVDIFEKLLLDKSVNKTEISMDRRIYVFEDFDANNQGHVFNIRDALKADSHYTKSFKTRTDETETKKDAKDSGKEEAKKVQSKESEEQKQEKNETKGGKSKDGVAALVTLLQASAKEENFSSLNLTDILNILDGICERTGQRCIWTTNKNPPQKHFDPAFLRPGRMDMIIELGRCDHQGINYLVRSYFKDFDEVETKQESEEEKYGNGIDDAEDIDYHIQQMTLDLDGVEENRFTPAQIKQICKEALNMQSAVRTMMDICSSKAVLKEEEAKQAEEELDSFMGMKSMHKSKLEAIKKTRSEPTWSHPKGGDVEALGAISDIKRISSGHWFEPREDVVEQIQYIDTSVKHGIIIPPKIMERETSELGNGK